MLPGYVRLPVLTLGIALVAAACSPIDQTPSPLLTSTAPTVQIQNSPAPSLVAPLEASLGTLRPVLPTPTTGVSFSPPETANPPPALTPTPTVPAYRLVSEVAYRPWEQVLALAWAPDGQTLAAAAGETIHLLGASDFTELLALPAGVWSSGLAYSPQGDLLASAGRDGLVLVWDAARGEQVAAIQAHKKGANCVAFSPDGRLLASGGNDGMVRLWDPRTGKASGQIIGGTFSIPNLAFSLDGASIAIVNGDIIRFRDTSTLRFVQTLRGERSLYSLDISPDGANLAAGDSAGGVQVWDLASGEKLAVFETERSGNGRSAGLVWQVAYSPDGLMMVAATGDGWLWLWETKGNYLLARLPAHSLAATSVAFSPDGRWLASGGLDGAVRVWQMP